MPQAANGARGFALKRAARNSRTRSRGRSLHSPICFSLVPKVSEPLWERTGSGETPFRSPALTRDTPSSSARRTGDRVARVILHSQSASLTLGPRTTRVTNSTWRPVRFPKIGVRLSIGFKFLERSIISPDVNTILKCAIADFEAFRLIDSKGINKANLLLAC